MWVSSLLFIAKLHFASLKNLFFFNIILALALGGEEALTAYQVFKGSWILVLWEGGSKELEVHTKREAMAHSFVYRKVSLHNSLLDWGRDEDTHAKFPREERG